MKSNEKFTQRAELAIERARRAAGEWGHSRVGTEHLLLGILQEQEGLGARILGRRGLKEEALRRAILRRWRRRCAAGSHSARLTRWRWRGTATIRAFSSPRIPN